jgi:imidazolonepropionase-like amidohydrolase
LLLVLGSLGLAGCECETPDDPDAGDAALPDGGPQPDASTDDGGMPGPMVTLCPGDDLPPLEDGVCEATPGDGNLLITGDVLTPGEVLRGGQVLVDPDGNIACVGCDCSGEAGASGATTVVCPDGVVSPGLINAHEHLTFQANPAPDTGERYEHRHDWRTAGPSRGHNEIPTGDDVNSESWDELRMVMAGVTSVNGSGSSDGLARNLDRSAMEGLGQPPVEYDTFPLDDGGGELFASGCDGYSNERTGASDIDGLDAYTPHVAEGIDRETRNEFLCQREGDFDLVEPQTAIIHGVGLLAPDIAEMAEEQVELIWSPRTNIFLYGDTARVTLYDHLGVLIALGTDWQRSGSMNMLRELQCADRFNADYLGGHFTDEQLWLMATRNGAVATATDDAIGTLAPGLVADIAIFDGRTNVDHRAVIDAQPQDVALVLRGGEVLYGEAPVVDALESGCDPIDVCGASRAACVSRELGTSLSDLSGMNAEGYPLFFCDGSTPTDEPTCIPSRDAMEPLPSPIVDGSNRYSGMITADDMDGDGIPDADDNCASIFNPIRPLDEGAQADFDMDGVGDACDPCPLDADTTDCSPVDPDDRDNDGVTDTVDNCPGIPNADQSNVDGDDTGDVCDLCPEDPNPAGAACPATIYEIKRGDFTDGNPVAVTGAVVTAVGDAGFTMQVPIDHPDYVDANYSGVYVYTGGAPERADGTPVARGMTVDVEATIVTFAGQTQLGSSPTITASTETSAVPDAVVVTDPATIADGGSMAEALEAVLVTVEDVAVTDDAVAEGQFEVDASLVVGDFFHRIDPFVSTGENFDAISGVLFALGGTRLQPRDADDFLAGAPQLAGLGPTLSYARLGDTDAPTFPEPLTVRLTRATGTATTVTVTSSSPTELMVENVTVPAGASSAPVPVTASALDTYTVTATLGGDTQMADVRVLEADEAPAGFTLDPAAPSVNIGGTVTFTVTLDIPAPPGGQQVDLSETTGGVLTPAPLVVPADTLSATFDYTAPATETTGVLTATLNGTSITQTADLTVVASPGTVILNEIDYDQDGTDASEFIELYNPGALAMDLSGVELVLVNGSGSSVYDTIDLSAAGSLPAGGYLVVRAPGLTVASGALTLDFSSATNNVQNGGPDGVAVWDSGEGVLLDALSYEGSITAVTIGGASVSLVEGTATGATDDASSPQSLSRIPNGSDTDDAATDWAATPCVTPGEANAMSCP